MLLACALRTRVRVCWGGCYLHSVVQEENVVALTSEIPFALYCDFENVCSKVAGTWMGVNKLLRILNVKHVGAHWVLISICGFWKMLEWLFLTICLSLFLMLVFICCLIKTPNLWYLWWRALFSTWTSVSHCISEEGWWDRGNSWNRRCLLLSLPGVIGKGSEETQGNKVRCVPFFSFSFSTYLVKDKGF